METNTVKTKEFFARLCILLPMAFWGLFIVLILFGIVASKFGANSWFYCNVYCKVGVGLFIVAFLAIIYCQAKSCCRLK